ncbi:MAG: AMP-binding protein, partial [Halieaceae bacterium]
MDYVRFHAILHGDNPAVSDLSAGREFSYHALDLYVARCTSYLIQQNCVPGDRVACLARNSADVLSLSLASARLGTIFVPLNWRLSDAELNSLLEDCSPKCLFADQKDRCLNVEVTPLQDLETLCETAEPC